MDGQAGAGASPRSPPPLLPPPLALNAEQLAAACAPIGEALLVLAAAGTGKTTTMRERVSWMLQQVCIH